MTNGKEIKFSLDLTDQLGFRIAPTLLVNHNVNRPYSHALCRNKKASTIIRLSMLFAQSG